MIITPLWVSLVEADAPLTWDWALETLVFFQCVLGQIIKKRKINNQTLTWNCCSNVPGRIARCYIVNCCTVLLHLMDFDPICHISWVRVFVAFGENAHRKGVTKKPNFYFYLATQMLVSLMHWSLLEGRPRPEGSLLYMFSVCRRKPEYAEKTDARTRRTCKIHIERPQI